MDKKFKEVSYDEYHLFLKNYPKQLEFYCSGIFEPPLGTWNDFSDNKVWPDSIVAKEVREWMGPNGELDKTVPGKYWTYYILTD